MIWSQHQQQHMTFQDLHDFFFVLQSHTAKYPHSLFTALFNLNDISYRDFGRFEF